MKKISKVISIISILALMPTISFAALPKTTQEVRQAAQTTLQEQRMTSLRQRADQEITRRINALNQVSRIINNLKRLTAEEKASFTTQIQNNISDLTNLKTKIDADTDLATLKADVQSVVGSYRIFALFIPKIHLLSAADKASEAIDTLNALSTKLSTRINEEVTNGQNVTAMQTSLADMTTKIADAKTLIAKIQTEVTPLDPSGYPGNKGTLSAAYTDIKTLRTDLTTARQDAQSIVNALKALK